jgi:hypothetical protein
MLAQSLHGLVLFVANALGGKLQFLGDFRNGPTFEAHLQDALLSWRKHIFGCLLDDFALVRQAALALKVAVGNAVEVMREFACPLMTLLDSVDRPNEFAAVIAVATQNLAPGFRRHSFQQSVKDLLRAIAPGIGRQASIPPTRRAIPAKVVDRSDRCFG